MIVNMSKAQWHAPLQPALGGLRQQNQGFKARLVNNNKDPVVSEKKKTKHNKVIQI